MDRLRNDLLAEMARDAALERSDFLVRAGEQLERFLHDQADRVRELGGLTLIDDDPDYLALAPDGTFRSRSRVYDEATGEWHSETEIIETGGELVELYNPADVFSAFADAAREGVWADGVAHSAGEAPADGEDGGPIMTIEGADPYAGAADRWAAGQPDTTAADDEQSASSAIYELALDFQERSQRSEAGLIEQFENASNALMSTVGTIVIVDDLDEHLELGLPGFRGRVIPEGATGWTDLDSSELIVRFYDPTDVFGDLADAIAEKFPEVVGEGDEVDADDDDADAEDDDADGESDDVDAEDDDPDAEDGGGDKGHDKGHDKA
ncbi:MAG: hypothetical protein HYX54_04855 [Chloroflexi bacterium]|nr:hypothetical protein [Chloroflexota bacterium]